jgi:xanthine phosphoribosyltransferase
MKKRYYNYDEFKSDTLQLLDKLKSEEFQTIIAISRGGLTLAHMLSEALEIRDVQAIQTQLYDDSTKREKITIKGSLSLQPKSHALVVDDIADSGETLHTLFNTLSLEHPETTLKTATLFYKRSSRFEPDYWVREAHEWIEFFWEVDFSSC